jgi:hypothetical protein
MTPDERRKQEEILRKLHKEHGPLPPKISKKLKHTKISFGAFELPPVVEVDLQFPLIDGHFPAVQEKLTQKFAQKFLLPAGVFSAPYMTNAATTTDVAMKGMDYKAVVAAMLVTEDAIDLMRDFPTASGRGCELFALHGACFHRSIANLDRHYGKRRQSAAADVLCSGK